MKYNLLLIIGIVTSAYSCEDKKISDPMKDCYKRKLHTAVTECKKHCVRKKEKEKEVECIKKYASNLMQHIAKHLVAPGDYTIDTFSNDHTLFLEFIIDLTRKINPKHYQDSLQKYLDDVNEAFNDMKHRKVKEIKKRKTIKKECEHSDSSPVSNTIETEENEDEEEGN